jgi:hypothetical protein
MSDRFRACRSLTRCTLLSRMSFALLPVVTCQTSVWVPVGVWLRGVLVSVQSNKGMFHNAVNLLSYSWSMRFGVFVLPRVPAVTLSTRDGRIRKSDCGLGADAGLRALSSAPVGPSPRQARAQAPRIAVMDAGGSFLDLAAIRIAVVPAGAMTDARFTYLASQIAALDELPANALPKSQSNPRRSYLGGASNTFAPSSSNMPPQTYRELPGLPQNHPPLSALSFQVWLLS